MIERIKKNITVIVRGWIVSIIIALLIATSFKSAVADWNVVPTGSMKPTIIEGDRIFVNKLAYDLKIPYTTIHIAQWGDPQRGDIVVFYSPADGRRLVKRVIGIPGDSISMRNNELLINGEIIPYESIDRTAFDESLNESTFVFFRENLIGRKHAVMITPSSPSMRSFGPVEVPQNKYFMMGDNRDNSGDSRFFGFVDRRNIVGRVSWIVISLDLDNYYMPRWNRSFVRLW
jgi:signal peptidase I